VSNGKYDVERFLTDVKSIFQTNLNTQIDCINTEKQTITEETNDNFAINRVSDSAWFFQQANTRVFSYPQFVVWGLLDLSLQAQQHDASLINPTVFIEVCLPDRGEPVNEVIIYKLLRYSRALQEIAEKNFDKLRGYGKIQVDTLSPAIVNVDGKKLRCSGIAITALFSSR